MPWLDVYGREVNHNVAKYAVKWNGKCRSKIQYQVKQFLKPYWQAHIVFEEFPCFGSLLKVDLLNMTLKLAVEVNGAQHESFNKFFHRDNPVNYHRGFVNDFRKLKWLEKNGYQLLEIAEHEVPLLSRDFFKKTFDITL